MHEEPYGEPAPPPGGWRKTPLRFSMNDFIQAGIVEGIAPGWTREAVRASVPKPIDWALTSESGIESNLWSFGPIDLIFVGDSLRYIFCDNLDFGRRKARNDNTIIKPGFVRIGMERSALERELKKREIRFCVKPGKFGALTALLIVEGSQVTFHMEAEPYEEPVDRMVVVAFERMDGPNPVIGPPSG